MSTGFLILGPTASGKSDAAMRVARALPAEIVSVDSAQVYRGMDIGTAKPSRADREAVPHHLIDIVDPAESYSAARFAQDARRAVAQIRARGRIALLVGGTMLYARALTAGLHALPGADPAIRARLDAEAARDGWPALHARLARVDPASAARLQPADAQRIQRALEVFELTGEPMSRLLAGPAGREGAAANPEKGTAGREGAAVDRDETAKHDAGSARAGERWLTIALEPSDRSVLHARIAQRLRAMIDAGLLDEVRRLRARGDLHPGLPSMRCVGYRQLWEHLDGRYDLDTAIERAIAATRQLAKRQLTWLRAMPERVVVDCLAPDAAEQVLQLVQEHR